MENLFPEFKKNLAFGCMRLPMNGEEVDYEEFIKMVDAFLENGFNYFDTARVYTGGKSEIALRECLVKRHPRESFVFVNKLSNLWTEEEDILPLFNSQLESCGLEYFDIYLMHALGRGSYPKYHEKHAFDIGKKLKAEGKIKHLGISFHDSPDYLDKILTEHPEIEIVQIQFNYLDLTNPKVESANVYEVARKHNKPILVMEPVKGGALAVLPDDAKQYYEALGNASPASYAIRYAASQPGIVMVLSGMSNMDQMMDNISYMKEFKPLNEKELEAVENTRNALLNNNAIQCTGCHYCTPGCPKQIAIPELFSLVNEKRVFNNWNLEAKYEQLTTTSKASDCIKCGKCEKICPQHLEIRKLLEETSNIFEK